MTKQIEDALNLPRLEDVLNQIKTETASTEVVEEELNKEVEFMANVLENIDPSKLVVPTDGIAIHNTEMDEVFGHAIKAHKDMVDLGYNVDSKHAGSIFSPAAHMLEIALAASKSKSEQILKSMKLQIEKARIELEMKAQNADTFDAAEDGSILAGRNDIMKLIRQSNKEK